MTPASENLDVLILDERGIANAVAQKELALGGLACFVTARRSEALALAESHRPYLVLYIPQTGVDAVPASSELAARVRNCSGRLLLVCEDQDCDLRRIAETGIGDLVAVPRRWRDLVPRLSLIRNDVRRARSLETHASFQQRLLVAADLGALVICRSTQEVRWLTAENTALQPAGQQTDALSTDDRHWRRVLTRIDTHDRARVSEFIGRCLNEPRNTSLTALTIKRQAVNLACVPDSGSPDELMFVIRHGRAAAGPRTVGDATTDAGVLAGRPTAHIRDALRSAMREHDTGAVLLVQLQRTAAIYRHHGYRLGTRLLAEFGARLGGCLRAEDRVYPLYIADGCSRVVAQISDADFVVLLDQPESDTPMPILRRIRSMLGTSIAVDGTAVEISYAFGFARWPEDGTTPDSLLHTANIAAARDAGRETAGPDSPSVSRNIEAALHEAIRQHAIRMTLQPKVSAGSGRIVGFEALARWEHDGEPVPPDVFIPVAERAGLIGAIGDSIADQAIAAHQTWRAAGLGCVPIAINVSPYQFDSGEFADRFLELCERRTLRPGCLSIEITESSLLRNEKATLAQLERLRAAGVTIALDDFGTGYSSLSYLRKLPLDVLKIDKSFIDDLTENAVDPGLVVSIIAIGTNLGLRVVAEGIETPAQQAMLCEWGCHELQGYWFAPPLGLAQATEVLGGSRVLPVQNAPALLSLPDRRRPAG